MIVLLAVAMVLAEAAVDWCVAGVTEPGEGGQQQWCVYILLVSGGGVLVVCVYSLVLDGHIGRPVASLFLALGVSM